LKMDLARHLSALDGGVSGVEWCGSTRGARGTLGGGRPWYRRCVAGPQPPKPFAYYERLSKKEKATYRKSDAIERIAIPDAPALRWLVTALGEALTTGKRARVAVACTALAAGLMKQLGVTPPKIHVRKVRPRESDGELHGLYTFAVDGKPPKLEVWMRTAAQTKVVSFRTFLRTFLHELAHHLDVELFGLDDSFHTEGFFRRESSLMRQLAPPVDAKKGSRSTKLDAPPTRKAKRPKRPLVQLALFPSA
jgi:hypothetical protein